MIMENDIPQMYAPTAELVNWAFRIGVISLIAYVWKNEARQYKQDLEAKALESRMRETMTHAQDFKELKSSVLKIDRLIIRIADKMNIPTKEYE